MSADLDATLARLDAVHAEDPRTVTADGSVWPYELLYARRMRAWLAELAPDASAALWLAVTAQHIRRWDVPRESYPAGRDGYIRWRTHAKRHQARVVARELRATGWDEGTIARVRRMVRKQGIKTDPEVQTLEDVAALVFLVHEAADFAARHDSEKVIRILAKTLGKMSGAGRAAAHRAPVDSGVRDLLRRADAEGG